MPATLLSDLESFEIFERNVRQIVIISVHTSPVATNFYAFNVLKSFKYFQKIKTTLKISEKSTHQFSMNCAKMSIAQSIEIFMSFLHRFIKEYSLTIYCKIRKFQKSLKTEFDNAICISFISRDLAFCSFVLINGF